MPYGDWSSDVCSSDLEDFVNPLEQIVSGISEPDQEIVWRNISALIQKLNRQGIISVQRSCTNCTYFSAQENDYFCNLLKQPLHTSDLRIDCHEFTAAV